MPHQESAYEASRRAMSGIGGYGTEGKNMPTEPPMVPSGKDFPMTGLGGKDSETNYETTGYYPKKE